MSGRHILLDPRARKHAKRALCGVVRPKKVEAPGIPASCQGCLRARDEQTHPTLAPQPVVPDEEVERRRQHLVEQGLLVPSIAEEHAQLLEKHRWTVDELVRVRRERDKLAGRVERAERDVVTERRRRVELEAKDRFHSLSQRMVDDGRMADLGAFYAWAARFLDIDQKQVHARMLTPAQVDALIAGAAAYSRAPQKRKDTSRV